MVILFESVIAPSNQGSRKELLLSKVQVHM